MRRGMVRVGRGEGRKREEGGMEGRNYLGFIE